MQYGSHGVLTSLDFGKIKEQSTKITKSSSSKQTHKKLRAEPEVMSLVTNLRLCGQLD